VPYWSITAVKFCGVEASGKGILMGGELAYNGRRKMEERRRSHQPTCLAVSVKNLISPEGGH